MKRLFILAVLRLSDVFATIAQILCDYAQRLLEVGDY